MASSFRLRVAGLTLRVSARRPTRFLGAPRMYRRFLAARGGDIQLSFEEQTPPSPEAGALLFDSGGVWRVHRRVDGLLYTFRSPVLSPPLYKAVLIDEGLRHGQLFYPRPLKGRRPSFALAYPLDELLFQHRFARDGALEIHACGLFVGSRVALFAGQSGAGKSTTARLWRRHRPETAILSDDRVVLRRNQGRLWAHGTPWHGDGGFARNESGPLGAIFFLKHAARTSVRAVAPAAAAAQLMARAFPPPWDATGVGRALDLCGKAATSVPCFELSFRRDPSAIEAVREIFA